MRFDEFILSKLIRQDIVYVSCQFSHPSNDLQTENMLNVIREEGYRRNYTDDRITRECNAVINNFNQFRQRKRRNVFHFKIEENLPLGRFFELTGHLLDFPGSVKLTLMRVGHNNFCVLKTNNCNLFCQLEVYGLEEKTYFSAIKGETPDPFIFTHNKRRLPLIINNLNLVLPSVIERAIDSEGLSFSTHAESPSYVLHDNPMSLLFHEFSSQLPKYTTVLEGQSVASSVGNKSLDNITDFIKALVTFFDGCTSEEVVCKYPDWLKFCHANGLSVMTLDALVNLLWNMKAKQ